MNLLKIITLPILGLCLCSAAYAQDNTTSDDPADIDPIDEVIVEAQRGWEGHEGMDAFWAGDYKKAEIEFEREFLSLKRSNSARENAINAAALGVDRAGSSADMAGSGGQSNGGPGGGVPLNTSAGNVDLGVNGSFSGKRSKGKNLLNDGVTTEEDFGFTKYMSGLSELKLKKYSEAKKSFKRSIWFDGTNHDARMRLGLIYVMDGEFDKAADQLEKIEKMRVKCKKHKCENYDEILESAATLAGGITKKIRTQ